jgi:Rad52/22 family double-strand break repair protein
MNEDKAKALRAPFRDDQIEAKNVGQRSYNFINHAVVTDRLISVDPAWYWQPMALADNGSPVLDEFNGLWIRLTVCGVTRIGYGASEPHQKGADAVKTAISDAIKNAAMRFGVALDLWGADSNGSSVELATTPFTPPLRSVPPLKAVETDNPELAAFLDTQRPESEPTKVVPPEGEPYCNHREMACRVYRSGTSNSGKPYEGLFCQRKPYTEQCTPMSLEGKPWKK